MTDGFEAIGDEIARETFEDALIDARVAGEAHDGAPDDDATADEFIGTCAELGRAVLGVRPDDLINALPAPGLDEVRAKHQADVDAIKHLGLDEVFPELTDEQVELREKVRAKHQADVYAIQRRGLHDRIVAKIRHWLVLEEEGFPLGRSDKAEVVLLKTMLDEIVEDMEE